MNEPKGILGWPVNKPLADFEVLAWNLRKEGRFTQSDLVLYLIERVKLAESRPTDEEIEKELTALLPLGDDEYKRHQQIIGAKWLRDKLKGTQT